MISARCRRASLSVIRRLTPSAHGVVPPLFESRLEEVLFWVVFIGSFGVPLLVFGRWSRKNAASMRSAPRRDVSTLTNFALIPACFVAIALGYARIGALPPRLSYPRPPL